MAPSGVGRPCPLLRATNLSHTLPGASAPLYTGVSLSVAAGEVLFLAGASGSGKSTLLRALSGAEPLPVGAGVTLHPTPLAGERSPAPRRGAGGALPPSPPDRPVHLHALGASGTSLPQWRARVVHVPQSRVSLPGTPSGLLARVMAFAAQTPRQDAAAAAAAAAGVAAAVGLPPGMLDQEWSSLSGGEAARAALAVCLATRPEVLLLDEVTASVDPVGTRRVERAVAAAAAAGAAVVWVSHDEAQPARVGGRLLRFPPPAGGVADRGGETPTEVVGGESDALDADADDVGDVHGAPLDWAAPPIGNVAVGGNGVGGTSPQLGAPTGGGGRWLGPLRRWAAAAAAAVGVPATGAAGVPTLERLAPVIAAAVAGGTAVPKTAAPVAAAAATVATGGDEAVAAVTGPVTVSLGAVVATAATIVGVAAASMWMHLQLETKVLTASARCAMQLFVLGFVLVPIFTSGSTVVLLAYLALMVVVASAEATRRTKYTTPNLFGLVLCSIAVAAAVISAFGLGIILRTGMVAQYVIPIVGMLLGNSLSAVSVSLSHLLTQFAEHPEPVTTYLALGADCWEAARDEVRSAMTLGLTPILNTMSVTGIVSIPGLMTGQLLSGTSPAQATRYQTIILFLICGTSCVAVLSTVLASAGGLFDADHRLLSHRLTRRPPSALSTFLVDLGRDAVRHVTGRGRRGGAGSDGVPNGDALAPARPAGYGATG
ncbi:hypothetical protein MMPV_000496 [Pyropia vietnamensis]